MFVVTIKFWQLVRLAFALAVFLAFAHDVWGWWI